MIKSINRNASLTVGFSFVFMVTVGFAQPRDNPIERARHHMELGQDAFATGNHEEAADHFIQAYSASPFSAFLYNAAMAYEKANNTEKAVDLYRRYLEAEPEAEDFAKISLRMKSLLAVTETEGDTDSDADTDAKEPVGPVVEISEIEMKSLISVETNPPDATVRILDGASKEISSSSGQTAQTVERGTYTIEVSHSDYRTVQTDISVAAGQVYIVVVEMSQGAFLGFLHVTTDVPGAKVYLDDRAEGEVGITPWGNPLPTGKHTIWVEKPGFETITKEVDIQLGDEHELPLQLKRLSFGKLFLKTNIEATLSVDGLPKGKTAIVKSETIANADKPTPQMEARLSPGTHQIIISADGMKDYVCEVDISRGQVTKLLVQMNSKPSRTSAWVSAGFSAALFIGGGVAGYMAHDIRNELRDTRNEGLLANDDPRILKGFLWGLGADTAFGVGTIVGALSIYYFVRDPLPPSKGKLFKPTDFDKNPQSVQTVANDGNDSGGVLTEPKLNNDSARTRPRLMVAPLITTDTAGFGLAVTF